MTMKDWRSGRPRKYTDQERLERQRRMSNDYYYRNKQMILAKQKARLDALGKDERRRRNDRIAALEQGRAEAQKNAAPVVTAGTLQRAQGGRAIDLINRILAGKAKLAGTR